MSVDVQQRIAEALAAQNERPSLDGLQADSDGAVDRTAENWQDPIRAGLSYYRIPDRRMPRGRITLLQNGQNAMEMLEYRNYESLRGRYGGYKSTNQSGDWQRTDPYLGLLQRRGLHELDGLQLHDLKWHHTPGRDANQTHRMVWAQIQRHLDAGLDREAAILAVMPQLAGFDLGEYPCALCPGRVGGPFATPDSLERHRAVMHKENVQTEGTRDAVAAALRTSGGDMSKLIEALTLVAAGLATQQSQQQGPREDPPEGTPSSRDPQQPAAVPATPVGESDSGPRRGKGAPAP